MQNAQIAQLIEKTLDAEVYVEGDGCHFSVTIISEQFTGLSRLKRQQTVYQLLNPYIESGDVHAVNMKTYTRQEWNNNHG